MGSTRDRIAQLLWRQGSSSVQELAGELGISPLTVRHHLLGLERDGLVSSNSVGPSGSVGRPRLTYALSPIGAESFPTNVQQLASLLLLEVQERWGPDITQDLLAGVARRMASALQLPPAAQMREKLDQIVHFLNNSGYLAGWAESTPPERGWLLHFDACPYRWLVQRNREVCTMDQMLLATLIGVPVEPVVNDRSREPRQCLFHIVPAEESGLIHSFPGGNCDGK